MRWIYQEYQLSDEPLDVDPEAVYSLLRSTYWAHDREREVMDCAIRTSLNFTLRSRTEVVGYARVITDYATFAWICDVVIARSHRGQGLGKWMVERVIEHPSLQVRSQWLTTQDAHSLYERFGFKKVDALKRSRSSLLSCNCPSSY